MKEIEIVFEAAPAERVCDKKQAFKKIYLWVGSAVRLSTAVQIGGSTACNENQQESFKHTTPAANLVNT